jgi:hypothetical protein
MNRKVYIIVLALAAVAAVGYWYVTNNSGEATTAKSNGEAFQPPPLPSQNDPRAALNNMPLTTIYFAETNHNFGKIAEGEKVSHRFTFKNTGDKPLLVADVKPSCGCTTPDWTKTEVAPGKEGYIMVQFDSQGRVGQQMKTVTVFANIKDQAAELHFTGEVVAAKK